MKKSIRFFAAIAVFSLAAAFAGHNINAQTVNMSRYITLTVQQGQQIRLDLAADADNTGVKVVSGSNEQTVTVGANWTGFQNYTAGATTMTIYGNVKSFDCSSNGTKLTALDVSHNTALENLICYSNQLTVLDVSHNTALTALNCYSNQLTALDVSNNTALIGLICYSNQLTALDVSHNTALENLICYSNQLTVLDVSHNTALTALNCYSNQLTALDVSNNTALTGLYCNGNNFTTEGYDDLMCSLPTRTAADNGVFEPLYNSDDANRATFLASNSQNAMNKNWNVLYYEDDSEIEATTGTYVCGSGIADVEQGEMLAIYPNPAKDEIFIEGIHSEIVRVYSLDGKLQLSEIVNERLDISMLASGTYIINAGGKQAKIVKK